jgi:hypothetical protein
LQTLLIAHQALVCVLIIFKLLIRLKVSFIAPKNVLQEFADSQRKKTSAIHSLKRNRSGKLRHGSPNIITTSTVGSLRMT